MDEYDPGYSKVAAFLDCAQGFLIYRKFSWLSNRVLLHTQDELQELEEKLEVLDKWEFDEGDRRKLGHRRIDENDPDSPRKELLVEIKGKLDEYHEMLFRLERLQAIKRPSKRNQNSVYNLITNTKSIGSGEALWIRQWDDLAALAHDSEHRWFQGAVEDFLTSLSPRITMVSRFTSSRFSFQSITFKCDSHFHSIIL